MIYPSFLKYNKQQTFQALRTLPVGRFLLMITIYTVRRPTVPIVKQRKILQSENQQCALTWVAGRCRTNLSIIIVSSYYLFSEFYKQIQHFSNKLLQDNFDIVMFIKSDDKKYNFKVWVWLFIIDWKSTFWRHDVYLKYTFNFGINFVLEEIINLSSLDNNYI